MNTSYRISPITTAFGAAIRGISLVDVLNDQGMIDRVKKDLYKYRLLIFKDQGKMSAHTQLAVSQWFGKIESTFHRHPKSPDPDIFRVSNDPKEGCVNVGRSGWHIDGTFLQEPFKIQTMHFWAVSQSGDTHFVPLQEVTETLEDKEKDEWNRLWFVSNHSAIHPLIYKHPITNKATMCFHCGEPFVESFLLDYDKKKNSASQIYSWDQTKAVLHNISKHMESSPNKYSHCWEIGDFAIMDNLAISHYADSGTQLSPEQDGLRILHRTTVAGDHGPLKK